MADEERVQSSSAKKKAKKEKKKRKRDSSSDGASSSSSSPAINGNGALIKDNGGTTSSSKKKKKKKDKKKHHRQSKENGSTSITKHINGYSLADPDSAAAAQQQQSNNDNAQQQQQQQTINTQSQQQPPPSGSIFNITTSAKKNNKSLSSSSSTTTSSPYQIKTIQGSVALLPTSLPNVPQCIQSLLHSLLLMYDASMGGVLLSLEDDVQILPLLDKNTINSGGRRLSTTSSTFNNNSSSGNNSIGIMEGRIVDDLPYIHYRFSVSALLFCPTIGNKLRGQVIECTPTYVTLTCNHVLMTKISTESLREVGFFYDGVMLEWRRERDDTGNGGNGGEDGEGEEGVGPSTSIYLDDTVEFVVERIHECGGYISLDGTHPSVSTLG